MVKTDEDKRGWKKLHRGDQVRGRHPQTKEWSMKGEVVDVVHRDRAVFVILDDRSSRMYKWEDIRLDTTKKYQGIEEEELDNEWKGSELEARKDHKLEESLKVPRKARQSTNASDTGPRRSLRLAKKRVTLRPLEEAHDPNTLPYYMDPVEEGMVGRWWDSSLD